MLSLLFLDHNFTSHTKLFLKSIFSATHVNNYLTGADIIWHSKINYNQWENHPETISTTSYINRKAQASGWKKRDWHFNFDSFKLNANTCGKFEVHKEDSSEISDNQVVNRTRRSPQRPLDNLGVEGLRDRLQKRPRTGLDNEEVAPSRSPVEDKKADILQNSLSQGLQVI